MINSGNKESQLEQPDLRWKGPAKSGEIFSPNYPEIVGDKLDGFQRSLSDFLKTAGPGNLKSEEFVAFMASAMAAKEYSDGGNHLQIPGGES